MSERDDGKQPGFRTAGVIGAGTIGRSWLRVFARNHLPAIVYDRDPERSHDVATALQAEGFDVEHCHDLANFVARADYVQECVAEDLEAKQAVFAALDGLAADHVVLGSSTSAFPSSEFAAGLAGASRCLVVHPTNPPHLVPLVEIVPGPATSPDVTERVMRFMSTIGQCPILCRKEIYGFVLNRLQFALTREAFYLVRNGVASVRDIDNAVREGLGLRWAFLGPFGVEATNAATIEDDLRKFADLIRRLFAEVCQPYDGPDEHDIATIVDSVNDMFADVPQRELLTYRDTAVADIRKLKQGLPSPYD